MKPFPIATCVAACLVAFPSISHSTVPASGYVYARTVLSQLTEGCIAEGNGGVFVGVGPAQSFPPAAATRSIVFVTEGGQETVVATGLNAIGDCWYDRDADLLFVTDNGGDYAGATTGDTVFVIDGQAVADTVDEANELLPAGSIPFASSIAPFHGNLLVTNAAGGGSGSVIELDMSTMPPAMSTFAGSFDYTGGVLQYGDHAVVAESHEGAFNNSLHEFDENGTFLQTISGPTYAHGSIDVALLPDGAFAVTGNDTIVRVPVGGVPSPLVTGLDGGSGFAAFGGGISMRAGGQRVSFLASSFTGDDDDKSVHRLIPVASLVPGRGRTDTECMHEFYGVELVSPDPEKEARFAICTDGDACDADGAVDGGCTFPVGLCVNVPDERFEDCESPGISDFELIKSVPAGSAAGLGASALQNQLPNSDPTCVFTDGVRVELRSAGTRAGKGLVKVRATSSGTPARTDTDLVRLICQPAA
ncbi:MAG TPA: hypothetical protein VEC57_08575 [Candidatus Limnocylindrales bacterium]|nr:hypothetical protein [Candidatus Limnocylindrales bacterium]